MVLGVFSFYTLQLFIYCVYKTMVNSSELLIISILKKITLTQDF
jgi:hypothetical protein